MISERPKRNRRPPPVIYQADLSKYIPSDEEEELAQMDELAEQVRRSERLSDIELQAMTASERLEYQRRMDERLLAIKLQAMTASERLEYHRRKNERERIKQAKKEEKARKGEPESDDNNDIDDDGSFDLNELEDDDFGVVKKNPTNGDDDNVADDDLVEDDDSDDDDFDDDDLVEDELDDDDVYDEDEDEDDLGDDDDDDEEDEDEDGTKDTPKKKKKAKDKEETVFAKLEDLVEEIDETAKEWYTKEGFIEEVYELVKEQNSDMATREAEFARIAAERRDNLLEMVDEASELIDTLEGDFNSDVTEYRKVIANLRRKVVALKLVRRVKKPAATSSKAVTSTSRPKRVHTPPPVAEKEPPLKRHKAKVDNDRDDDSESSYDSDSDDSFESLDSAIRR